MDKASEDTAPMIATLLRKRGSIELPSFGMSMYPLIQEGNVSRFVQTTAAELKIGDICLFVSQHGIMTGHRLIGMESEDGERMFIFRGDTSYQADDPVTETAIMGKWTGVRRGRRWTLEGGFLSWLMRLLVLHIPVTRKVTRKLGTWSMMRKPMYRSET